MHLLSMSRWIFRQIPFFHRRGSVKLSLDAGAAKVRYVKYYLNSLEYVSTLENGFYTLSLNPPEPGTYIFKISIITETGTTSIADILGVEGFEYQSKEWTLIYTPIELNGNLSYRLRGDELVFTWKEFNGLGFKNYRLNELSTQNSFEISETTFTNTTYVGEQSYYDLYVVDNEYNQYLWGKCFVNKHLPELKLGEVNEQVALIWDEPVFKDNIAEFQLFIGDLAYNWTHLGTLPNTDTAFILATDAIPFGQARQFYLYCVPKTYVSLNNTSSFSSFIDYANVTLPGPEFEDNMGVGCSGFYFYKYSSTLKKNILYKYSIATGETELIMNYNYFSDFSPNEVYMVSAHDSIFDLYDLSTNTIVRSINVGLDGENYISFDPKISDNGICVFCTYNKYYAYDVQNDRLIATKNMLSGGVKISPDGSFFAVNREDSILIYKINLSSLDFLAGTKKSSSIYFYEDYGFCADKPANIYAHDGDTLYVKSCSDLSTIRSFFIGSWLYNIDFCTGKVLTARNARIWDIYDFNTGNLIQTITSGIGTGGTNYTLLTNNTLFFTGYRYFLNN